MNESKQLKTLQSAHEREMNANKETVRLLEQRLAEREEAFAIIQQHHKIPIDYFALKAKVKSQNASETWAFISLLSFPMPTAKRNN